MLDHYAGPPGRRDVADQRRHRRGLRRGHAAGRLVQQQQIGRADQGAGELETALLGQRQLAGQQIGAVGETGRREHPIALGAPGALRPRSGDD